MPTTAEELRSRTKQLAIRLVRLFRSLPKTAEAQIFGRQLLRSGTSAAANYRATCRSRSRAEFIAKLGVVIEELDETLFWLELISETDVIAPSRLAGVIQETNELTAIFVSACRSTKDGSKS